MNWLIICFKVLIYFIFHVIQLFIGAMMPLGVEWIISAIGKENIASQLKKRTLDFEYEIVFRVHEVLKHVSSRTWWKIFLLITCIRSLKSNWKCFCNANCRNNKLFVRAGMSYRIDGYRHHIKCNELTTIYVLRPPSL